MATALTFPLTENGHKVNLVGTHLDRDIIESIRTTGIHPDLGLKVNDKVIAYQLEDAETAFKGAEVAMSGISSLGVHWAGERLAKLVKPGMKVLNVTKGMEANDDGTLHLLPDVLPSFFDEDLANAVTWNAIVGPSIAREVALHHDTCVIFAGEDQASLDYLADLFRTAYYHVWTSTDFRGCQIGAATKNIYAFAAGLGAGLLRKEGKQEDRYVRFNYNAAVFGQGQTELRQFMTVLGGKPETADGLAGVGDMYVTSAGGRNVRAGT